LAWIALTEKDERGEREVLVNMDLVLQIRSNKGGLTELVTVAHVPDGVRYIYVQEDTHEIARILHNLGHKVKPPSR